MAKRVPDDIKAAVLADLAAGEQPAVVAQKYGIPASKVRTWKTRYVAKNVAPLVANAADDGASVALEKRCYPAVEERKQNISETILKLLTSKLLASQRIADAATTEWLQNQTARDVAELGEWLDRTAFAMLDRLVGAQRRAERDDTSD